MFSAENVIFRQFALCSVLVREGWDSISSVKLCSVCSLHTGPCDCAMCSVRICTVCNVQCETFQSAQWDCELCRVKLCSVRLCSLKLCSADSEEQQQLGRITGVAHPHTGEGGGRERKNSSFRLIISDLYQLRQLFQICINWENETQACQLRLPIGGRQGPN